MKKINIISVSAIALFAANPAFAQSAGDEGEIIVTAQRTAQSLQEVPIAVSAFSGEALEKQQIKNASDLQLTLPNVTFTKGNFTGSSFTIRGIGDLCVGTTCDSATAIHVNGTPLLNTRLFETEYFDLERVEVLRGPQGTLFGRNATSGVVNFVSAKPDLSGMHAAGEVEYGNFNAMKSKVMFNLPVGDKLGIRVAGYYSKRDGYTTNVYNNEKIDDRDMYAIRGSVRFEPTETTTIDLMGYYFREKDSRMRIQKQMCQRDPTGVLGCLPNRLEFGKLNANSTFVGVLTSREFLTVNGIPNALGLGSLYGPDTYAGFVEPNDVRKINTDFRPEYFTDEKQFQARVEQELGAFKVQATAMYQRSRVDSRQDYNQGVQNRAVYAAGLNTLAFLAAGGGPAFLVPYLSPIAAALIPNGPTGQLCTSDTESTGTGAFGGHKVCAATPEDFDRSSNDSRTYSGEAILSSDFDGKFNFLIGGIYVDNRVKDTEYYVNAFGIDYVTGILGSFTSLGRGLAPSYLGTPYYRSNTPDFSLKSYGLFGEAYFEASDKLKATIGIRYNSDKKTVSARTTLASFLVPYTSTDATTTLLGAGFDADPATICPTTNPATLAQNTGVAGALGSVVGCEAFSNRSKKFTEWTGRAVLDYKISDDNLVYASVSRGYKSGGFNPPLSPLFAVQDSFTPETITSFEIGSKNSFADGKLNLNLTAFYYKYKGLQLSRIVARTSVNDNVDADIYGLEAEAIIKPSREVAVNMNFSYLHTKVSSDKFLGNPRDPSGVTSESGGRPDAVIIKDITNGSNCAITSNAGSAAAVDAYVTAVNLGLGLKGPVGFGPESGLEDPVTHLGPRGAFGICGVLAANAGGNFTVHNAGVEVNIKGNKLPQAPTFKFSTGVQHTSELANGMTIIPRLDLTYTGESYGNIFGGRVNKIKGYAQANAQIQVNGRNDRWYVRGFVQNLFDNSAVTGLYVTDQSSGLFTNIFTLEPRRYGITAGVKF